MENVIGTKLGKLRTNKGVSTQTVADTITASGFEISRSAIEKAENGKRNLKLDALIQLAKYYNTSLDFIVGLSETESLEPDEAIAEKTTGLSLAAIKKIKETTARADTIEGLGQVNFGYMWSNMLDNLLASKTLEDCLYRISLADMSTGDIIKKLFDDSLDFGDVKALDNQIYGIRCRMVDLAVEIANELLKTQMEHLDDLERRVLEKQQEILIAAAKKEEQ